MNRAIEISDLDPTVLAIRSRRQVSGGKGRNPCLPGLSLAAEVCTLIIPHN